MKKIGFFLLALLLLVPVAVFSGCEYENKPKNIYKQHITLSNLSSDEYDGTYTEYIANEKAGAVVTVCSYFEYRNNKGSHSETTVWTSGVILNDDGYILTTSNAVYAYADNLSSSLSKATVTTLYVALNPIYGDEELYEAKLIDCDEDLNLAIIQLKDNFFYYSDAQNTASQKGFQFKSVFYDARSTLKTGDYCAFVGDLLGEGTGITAGVVSDPEMTVLDGVTYQGTTYRFIQSTAAMNTTMLGGALYDRNGYIIGIIASKVYSDKTYSEYHKVGLSLPAACAVDYIDATADKLKTVIEYNIAVTEA